MKLREIYSQEHGELYNYLKQGEDFDAYEFSMYIIQWAEQEFGDLENMEEELELDFPTVNDFHDLDNDQASEIYQSLTPRQKDQCKEWCKSTMVKDDPADAPSYLHMSVDKRIPRTTWLIHFSDSAHEIFYYGFKYGTDDMSKLGLTTHFYTGRGMKSGQGWNFAFIANRIRDILKAFRNGRNKYGKNAVMFMSSGVEVDHYGDEETQVIFQGKDVNPRDMVYLRDDGGTWEVMPRNGSRPVYKNDEIENVIKWVESNYQQYRNVL